MRRRGQDPARTEYLRRRRSPRWPAGGISSERSPTATGSLLRAVNSPDHRPWRRRSRDLRRTRRPGVVGRGVGV